METVLIFGMLTLFASMVANRASKLNRNPWTWGIAAWIVSPLGVWIVLEICGRKKVETTEEALKEESLEVEALEEEFEVKTNLSPSNT